VGRLEKEMSLALRVLIVSIVDIAATDSAIFYHLQKNPDHLDIPHLIAWILITLIPILATLGVWQYQQKIKK
jgi:hypothetical protein